MKISRPCFFNWLIILVLSICFSSCSTKEKGLPSFPIADKNRYVTDLTSIAIASRNGSDENHQKVQDLCASRLSDMGYSVEHYDFGGGVDIIGTKLGTVYPEEIVIVSAHYDTIVGGNGADDNASGVAAVLESARLLAAGKPERTIIIACWDQEEPAETGSYMYASRAKKDNSKIQVAYVYDEIGYASSKPNSQSFPSGFEIMYPLEAIKMRANNYRGDFVLLIFDNQAKNWAQIIANSADQESLLAVQLEVNINKSVPIELKGSDHQSFWDKGFSAIEITDSAGYRNPYQHTDKDVLSTLNNDYSVKIISAVVASVETVLDP
jgi:Zn-dependent M28 family amino/carboxypeptidase